MSKQQKNQPKITGFSPSFGLATQEAPMEVSRKKGKLLIGIPKETSFQENRVGITPKSVDLLTNNGHHVVIESKAGVPSHFTDEDYNAAGAEVVPTNEKVFKADIVIKVAPPTTKEIDLLKPGQIIISPIHLPTVQPENIRKLMTKRVTALAFEYIKDESDTFPIVRSMSEIAGNASILIAAEYLNNMNKGRGVMLGGIAGIPPAKVVIIGAGVVGEFATRAALGLGAEVRVFDDSIYKLMRLQNNVNTRVYTSIIQPDTLRNELSTADAAIGAKHSETGRTPCIVTDDMVANMKAGAVIVDVSIDQGGCFETSRVTTHDEPTYKKYGVVHYAVPNIPSRVSRTASYAISNLLTPILLQAGDTGGFEKMLWSDAGVRHGAYTFKGYLTNYHLSQQFDIKFTDLELLYAANI